MKIHLSKAIFINRAPFESMTLDFAENEIAVLTAVNGKGKTTILSHITDAFYEMARPHFQDFEDKKGKFYRISSAIYNLNSELPSFVYFRFITSGGNIDYVDIRNKCTEEEYNSAIQLADKIPYSSIKESLDKIGLAKKSSITSNKDKTSEIFNNNILTYFPSYRHETPGYLNDPYKIQLDFNIKSGFSGYLTNPIEVTSGLSILANWLMDIVLDSRDRNNVADSLLFNNMNSIITQTLISKNHGPLRFGVGPRGYGSTRIQILENKSNGKTIYPTIFNLSSGESSILCLFGELLRQADNINNNIQTPQINGIVLIDEVDKHLHIKLQHEVLPNLFKLFPNIQFITSSHSPFLSMGLAEGISPRAKIVDLDNLGTSRDPSTNDLYKEVYNLMINENERFKEMYFATKQQVDAGTIPLIITEGKTDIKHIQKAKELLKLNDFDIDYFIPPDGEWGDSKLKLLLEQLSKVPQSRKVIGIFDRDVSSIVSDIEKNSQVFKAYGNNVYAFCIPAPTGRESYTNISIEFYYDDNELKKSKDGKSLYFDNEVDYLFNKSTNKPELRRLDTIRTEKENQKKVFDEEKMCEVADWIHSKARFANLVESDGDFIVGFNFNNFSLIFDKIQAIIVT